MNDSLVHRGPDESGEIVLTDDGVALAMRRLSIIDITGGHQPMWDEGKDHVTVFNGEIYNHADLRAQLSARGHHFTSHHSDTEVVVHGYEEWGPELFQRLHGMFAIAVWSRKEHHLVLARDRLGEKPVYIAETEDGFAFGSELKALLRHPGVSRVMDPRSIQQYLSFGFVLGPRTILQGVSKLPAAHYAIVTPTAMQIHRYWRMDFTNQSASSKEELIEQLDSRLDAAVRSQMVADVPVGVFLSGGIDSSTMAYYMMQHSSDVHSFSVGFDDPRFDESRFAATTARHLGTKHHTATFTDATAVDLVPKMAEVLDEPMSDSSILPTYLLSRLARQTVKVALGGDGSDELLMGYRAYKGLKVTWSVLDPLPLPARHLVANAARRVPERLNPRWRRSVKLLAQADRPHAERLLSALGAFAGDPRGLMTPGYRRQFQEQALDGFDFPMVDSTTVSAAANSTIEAYAASYLQEDILVKVDRASMAVSLEVRSPFLDVDLVEFVSTVPAGWKLHGLTGKYLLRELMARRLPSAVLTRPKRGFEVPIDRWLRTSLSPLLHQYLEAGRLAEAGIFDVAAVEALKRRHAAGGPVGQQLWSLLFFEMWRERWLA